MLTFEQQRLVDLIEQIKKSKDNEELKRQFLDYLHRVKGTVDVNFSIKDGYWEGPFLSYLVASRMDSDYIQALIDAGARVNEVDNNKTALFHAVSSVFIDERNMEVIKVLIKSRADLNMPVDEKKMTMLMFALMDGHNNAVAEVLIDEGADIHAKDSNGNTALHYTVRSSIALVKKLINAGADVNAVNNEGKTLMHLLSKVQHPDFIPIITELVKYGADINARDANGRVPLMLTCRPEGTESFDIRLSWGNLESLIMAGADPNIIMDGKYQIIRYCFGAPQISDDKKMETLFLLTLTISDKKILRKTIDEFDNNPLVKRCVPNWKMQKDILENPHKYFRKYLRIVTRIFNKFIEKFNYDEYSENRTAGIELDAENRIKNICKKMRNLHYERDRLVSFLKLHKRNFDLMQQITCQIEIIDLKLKNYEEAIKNIICYKRDKIRRMNYIIESMDELLISFQEEVKTLITPQANPVAVVNVVGKQCESEEVKKRNEEEKKRAEEQTDIKLTNMLKQMAQALSLRLERQTDGIEMVFVGVQDKAVGAILRPELPMEIGLMINDFAYGRVSESLSSKISELRGMRIIQEPHMQ